MLPYGSTSYDSNHCAKLLLVTTAVESIPLVARANEEKSLTMDVTPGLQPSTKDWQAPGGPGLFFWGGSPQEVIIYDNVLLKWAQWVIHLGFKRWIGRWWWWWSSSSSFWYVLIIATLWPPIRCERICGSCTDYRKSQKDRKDCKKKVGFMIWYLCFWIGCYFVIFAAF